MAITSVGYGGTIDEAAWARIAPHLGAEYGAVGAGDWRVTIDTSGDRRVKVAPGTLYGRGIFDVLDLETTLSFPEPSAGSNWYVVLARRSWTGAGGDTILVYKSATTTGNLPATVEHTPTLDEQPIALVKVTKGDTRPTDVIDLRVWQANGGACAASEKVLQYLTAPGTEVWIDGVLWVRKVGSNSVAAWDRQPPATAIRLHGHGEPLQGGVLASSVTDFLVQAGSAPVTVNAAGDFTVVFDTPFPSGVLSVQATLSRGAPRAVMCELYSSAAAASARPNRIKFSGRIYRSDGAPDAGQTHRVDYLAIGW